MRLHSLSVTAFGPFADTVSVDFDTLSDAGLFLLCGPTGAGKSSILDAVCFALYGEVPGDRSTARRLRCDLAAPGVSPRVVLDVTLGERRFLVTRSPAWQRPKKRGTGTTPQQASVLLQEVVDGSAQHLTNRLDEAGHLISGLLGMNLPQFTQVAMLPQGRFQDFLRAKSEDRHTLLQKLFRTRRFEEVERWLRERRISLRRESEAHSDLVSGLIHRLDEVSGRPFRDEVDDAVIASSAADGSLATWARGTAEAASAAVRVARAGLAGCTRSAELSTAELMAGRTLAEQQSRWSRAAADLARLAEHDTSVARQRRLAAAARRAAPVSAVHHQVVRAGARFDLAHTSAERAQQVAAGVHPGPLDLDQLRQVSAQVRDSVAEARAMLPVAAETADLAARVASLEADETALLARTARLQAEVVSLPASVEVAAAQVETARSALEGLPHAGERVEALVARLSARRRVTELSTRLDQARDVLRASVDTHQILREHWLERHESRLNGMAAEIAVALAVGGSCPVCGSCDHPAPATPTLGAPTAAEEKTARRRADDADVTRQAHADQVRSLETSLAVAREQAGTVDAAQLELEVASARSTTAHLQSLADGLPAAVATLDRARLALQRAEADLASARVAQGSLTTALTSDRERLELLSGSLTELLGDHRDLRALIDTRERHATVLTAALEALSARDRASTQLDEVTADLRRVAAECGFEDPDAAVAAHLPEAELTKLEAAVSAHDAACAAARAQLDDATLAVAATLPPPELDSLAAAHAAAADALAEAEATHRAAVEAAGRLEALRTQLFDALDAWAPVRDAYDLAARVSGFAEGKAGDNQAQMRLSAYVLSWRLGQVVDAANVRLARMTDQRYALEHTARKGAGETRGGLSLLVRDDWSGETRDPVTLSGGETFVVSLALALGLTDVVTQEAGGADIGTLFVDEGFGSLDADTLDDVMDTLDALRDGGRVVGIVSHVPELRTRIPAQLQVDKSRSGSRVRQVHLLT